LRHYANDSTGWHVRQMEFSPMMFGAFPAEASGFLFLRGPCAYRAPAQHPANRWLRLILWIRFPAFRIL
jgi:hypothetical protein